MHHQDNDPFNHTMQLLIPVITGQISAHSTSKEYGIPMTQLNHMVQAFTGSNLKQLPYQSIVIKDNDLRYQACNAKGAKLGTRKQVGNGLGLTDFEIAPEKADIFRSHDIQAIESKKEILAIEKVTIGNCVVNFEGHIRPILDDNDEPQGVIIVSNPLISFKDSFDLIFSLIRQGEINLLLRKHTYEFSINGFTISLSARELEILLYAMFGESSKAIGQKVALSYRTVENHIANTKEKLGCNTMPEMLDKLWPQVAAQFR